MCIIKLPAEPVQEKEENKTFGSLTKEISPNNRKALEHFSAAIELDSSYLKPVYQRMVLYKNNEDYEDALKDAKRIKELDPKFQQIDNEILSLEKLQAEKFEKMKTEVLGGLKNLGNMFLSPFGINLDNFKMQ